MEVVKRVIQSASENLEHEKELQKGLCEKQFLPNAQYHAFSEESSQQATNDDTKDSTIKNPALLGEGGESGDVLPGKSVSFAALEVCLCVLVRHVPNLNPAIPSTGFGTVKYSGLSDHACQLLSSALLIMADLPALCSPAGWFSFIYPADPA
jgi:hypothetical protein